ncbi:MAG: hypothetical protein Q4D54_06405 [Eubacteriales bacterium]|nr:hypothetical protein [Eubacteriales bacterium]
MSAWMNEIIEYIRRYFNHSPLLYLYIAALLFLLFRGKRIRRMVVYPSMILTVVVMNPICYGYIWIRLIEYAFWRMLWMIPVIPVIGCAVIELGTILHKKWGALVTVSIFVVCMVVFGTNVYQNTTWYQKGNNVYKLPYASVIVAQTILGLDEQPVVLAPSGLYCYLRQYSGDIKLLYGRDAETYILPLQDTDLIQLHAMIEDNTGTSKELCELAKEHNAEFIVLPDSHTFSEIGQYGYDFVGWMEGYCLYQVKTAE